MCSNLLYCSAASISAIHFEKLSNTHGEPYPSTPLLLLPSSTENPCNTCEDATGGPLPSSEIIEPPNTSQEEACLTKFVTLPSLQRRPDPSDVPLSQSSPHLWVAKSRGGNRTRRTFASQCSETASSVRDSAPSSSSRGCALHINSNIGQEHGNEDDEARIRPLWEPYLISENWPDDDCLEDAPFLVYRSADDCLPRHAFTPPSPQSEQFKPAGFPISDTLAAFGEILSSNSSLIIMKAVASRTPLSLRLSRPLRSFKISDIVESISRFPGELASSMVAKYWNEYMEDSDDEDCSVSSDERCEWEVEMRSLEMQCGLGAWDDM